ncbi:MAG: hypothetical protein HOP19_23875 [Acidobacteria bacterium]|nr:hypothetical protein [Acidobacteriota bacterium]
MPSDQVSRFLLGCLPESEMQRLNSLLETDAPFQQRVKIVEEDLIDCFVNGQLRGEDLMRFRRYFLAAPAHRERVKIAQGYLDDWAVLSESEAANETEARESKRRRPVALPDGVARLWATFNLPVRIGVQAAMLLAAAICAFLLFDTLRLQRNLTTSQTDLADTREQTDALHQELLKQQREAANAEQKIKQLREQLARPTTDLQSVIVNAANSALAALPPTAQAATPAVAVPVSTPADKTTAMVALPIGAEDLLFHLDLTRDTSTSYRAELRTSANGQKLWESGTLKAREKDTGRVVEVKVPATLLAPRPYVLKVIGFNGITATPYALHYSFRVTPPAAPANVRPNG